MREFFCGWYFKCQSDKETIALIPAVHQSGQKRTASMQLITDGGAWNIPLEGDTFQKKRGKFQIQSGENIFCSRGIRISQRTQDCKIFGALRFGPLAPVKYDMMGPFRFVPFMECRHSVVSMAHAVTGVLRINGVRHVFDNAVGYIEGDRGHSFPKTYAWTHSFFQGGSLMMSVADIPLGRFHFTGTICVVYWRGKEIRLATYLGAKIRKIAQGEMIISQGDLVLTAKLIEKHAYPLRAPIGGSMERTIHESAACRASYSLKRQGRPLFSFETDRASFEYEYPD